MGTNLSNEQPPGEGNREGEEKFSPPSGVVQSLSNDNSLERSPRLLCLHGRRTSGTILSTQTGALRAKSEIDCKFIDAPLPSNGDPDPGIARFYPGYDYFEWYHKNNTCAGKEDGVVVYEGLEHSINCILRILREEGPFDGLLGFSQGAEMVTRVALIREDAMKSTDRKTAREYEALFKFVVLIGGIPPRAIGECVAKTSGEMSQGTPSSSARGANNDDSSTMIDGDVVNNTMVNHTPSLHIMGRADPLLPRSELLCALYTGGNEKNTGNAGTTIATTEEAQEVQRVDKYVLTHNEGHNIPSIRTGLYPEIKSWIYAQTFAGSRS